MKYADLTLELHSNAWAVLHILAGREIDLDNPRNLWVNFSTAPWYNGRERGFVFTVTIQGKSLHIAVFEHRNSDSICALRWENKSAINPPTIESDGALAYPTDNKYDDIAHSVDYDEAGKMASWVADQMHEFATRHCGIDLTPSR